jgi:hypothetical protein
MNLSSTNNDDIVVLRLLIVYERAMTLFRSEIGPV